MQPIGAVHTTTQTIHPFAFAGVAPLTHTPFPRHLEQFCLLDLCSQAILERTYSRDGHSLNSFRSREVQPWCHQNKIRNRKSNGDICHMIGPQSLVTKVTVICNMSYDWSTVFGDTQGVTLVRLFLSRRVRLFLSRRLDLVAGDNAHVGDTNKYRWSP